MRYGCLCDVVCDDNEVAEGFLASAGVRVACFRRIAFTTIIIIIVINNNAVSCECRRFLPLERIMSYAFS